MDYAINCIPLRDDFLVILLMGENQDRAILYEAESTVHEENGGFQSAIRTISAETFIASQVRLSHVG